MYNIVVYFCEDHWVNIALLCKLNMYPWTSAVAVHMSCMLYVQIFHKTWRTCADSR